VFKVVQCFVGNSTASWVKVYAGINYTSMVDCKYFTNMESVSTSFNCFQPINARVVYIENPWGEGVDIQLCEVQIFSKSTSSLCVTEPLSQEFMFVYRCNRK
jgi:hypothetical protein